MELNEHDFSEELLALRRETWDTTPTDANQLFFNGCSFDYLDQNSVSFFPNSSCSQEAPQSYNNNYAFNEFYNSLLDEISAPQIIESSSYILDSTSLDTPPFLAQEDFPLCMMDEEDPGFLGDNFQSLDLRATCKMEPISQSPEGPAFNVGTCLEGKNRSKKIQGQPSKNLMAERRRRKRLNDRLSMLRSIVPKISKVSSIITHSIHLHQKFQM